MVRPFLGAGHYSTLFVLGLQRVETLRPRGALTQPGVAVLLVRAWSTTGGDFVPRGALIQPGVAVLLEWLCYLAVPKWYHTVEMPPQGSGAKCGMSTTPIRDTSQKSF